MKYEYESITNGIFRFTVPGEHRTVELFKGSKVIVPQLLTGNYLRLLKLVREIPDESAIKQEVKVSEVKKTQTKTTTQKAKVADKITAVTETVEVPKEEVEVEAKDSVVEVKETKVKPTAKPTPKRRGRKKKED
jgi:hypothetical protein